MEKEVLKLKNIIEKQQRAKAADKNQLYSKVIYLVNNEDFDNYLKKEINEIINGGFVDINDDEDGYALSKIILYCALKRLSYQYYPLYPDKRYEKLIKNY